MRGIQETEISALITDHWFPQRNLFHLGLSLKETLFMTLIEW